MRLNSLVIKNFRVIRSVNIDFGDQVTGIIGQNGAGKSSIIEAISWVLYGNTAARSGKDEIKSEFALPQDNCEVELSFSINGEKYKIIRQLIGKREHPEVQLFRGDNSESVGVKETQKYVGELLGLDWKGFNTSFLARQQELNALSDLQPKKRQDHLAGMLGIEKIDKAIKKTKEDIRRYKDRVQLLENQVGESSQLEKRIADLSRKQTELKQKQNKLNSELKYAEKALKNKSDSYQKYQESKSEWVKLSAQTDAVNSTLNTQNDNLERLNKEFEELKKLAQKAEKLKIEVVELPQLKRDFDNLKTAKTQFELVLQLQNRISEQENKKEKITLEFDKLAKKLKEYNFQLSEIPENIDSLAQQCKTELEEKREDYSDQKAIVETVKSQIEILKNQMKDINQFGPESVCDRCQRPFGDDLHGIKDHLNKELSKLSLLNESKSQKLMKLKKIGLVLKSKSEELDKSVNLYKEISINTSSSNREKASYNQQLQDVILSIEKDINQLREIDKVKFDENQFSDLADKIKYLENKQKELSLYQGKLSRQPIVDEDINNIQSRIKNSGQELDDLQKQKEKLSFSESSFQIAKEELESVQTKMDSIRNLNIANNTELKVTQKDFESQMERLDQLQKISQKLDESRDKQFYGQKLSQLFSEFREHLISRIRPTLSDFSSKLMEEMSDGRYSMVELDEDYNLRLMDSGSFFGIERFSGGEKDLANLCLRLSISLALTESAGLDRSFIILDEVFGSQDDERKELILKALANLKQRFPQILLITHVEDIRDRVDALIELNRKPSGWSEIEIFGQVQN